MPTHHCILALIYNEFEALDLFGPLGAIVPRSDYYTLKLVDIRNLNAPHGVESSIRNGIGVQPTISLAEALKEGPDEEQFDTLFIPGGAGIVPLVWDFHLLRSIKKLVDRAANVFTVCTGSLLLAATGKLDGRMATTNKRLFDETTPHHPGVKWQKRARWVEDGKFLTSSGVTAGIDAGLAFIGYTYVAPEDREANPTPQTVSIEGFATEIPGFDEEKAMKYAWSVALNLEYRWHPDPLDEPFVNYLPQASSEGAAV
ncbi:MAG: hypothetical protein Q9184_004688 [Pyrenodesmia sp. 2 TL-2023]